MSGPGARAGWQARVRWLGDAYHAGLRGVILALAAVAGVSLLFMVLVTTADVVLRVFRVPLTGAYDLVKMAGAVTLAGALPYATAIKGHVAIEYFSQRLGAGGRAWLDGAMRLIVIGLFGMLTWGAWDYGEALRRRGQVSMTLQLPEHWVAYGVAVSCGLVVLVKLYHLLHPGQALLKP